MGDGSPPIGSIESGRVASNGGFAPPPWGRPAGHSREPPRLPIARQEMTQPTSIDALLEHMVELGASDLHLTVGSAPAFRVRGHITPAADTEPLTPDESRLALYGILTSEQQKQLELNRQLDFAYALPGVARFRVNVYYQREAL